MDAGKLFGVLSFPSQEMRARLQAAFTRKACAVQDCVTETLTDAQIVAALTEGFAAELGLTLTAGDLTPREVAWAGQLRETKYSAEQWTLER